MSASGRPPSIFVLASSSSPSRLCRSEATGLPRAYAEEKMLSPSSPSEWPCLRAPADSPVSNSWLGLAETESEEEDEYAQLNGYCTAGLAKRIAHSMLQEAETKGAACGAAAWASQQPRPTGGGCWGDGLRRGRERTSPASSFELASPPSPPFRDQAKEDASELLYAEFMRLRMEEEMRLHSAAEATQQNLLLYNGRPMLVAPRSLNSGPVPNWVHATGYTVEHQGGKATNEFGACKMSNPSWPSQNLQQASYPHRSYSNATMTREVSWNCVGSSTSAYHHHTPSSGVPQQALRNGSGMRAVFLDTRGTRQSGGTGVFLPRRAGNGSDARRKPACSTVLLPSRIVQALNLNIEDTLSCPVSALAMVASRDRDALSLRPIGRGKAHEASPRCRDGWPPLHSQLQEVAPDISLPVEWTY